MGFVVITTLIAGIVAFICEYRSYHGYWLSSFLMSILVMILGFILSTIIVIAVSCGVTVMKDDSNYNTITTETKLVALKDSMSTRGGRYIYSGYIDEELKYTYLYKVPNKGITSKQVEADNCYINYINENETPKLVKIHTTLKEGFLDFITFDWIVDNTEYSLYVPNGSIVAEGEYEIDLE